MEFLQSGVLPTVLLIVRALVPLLALYVVWRCYTSFKKGQRRRSKINSRSSNRFFSIFPHSALQAFFF